MRSPIAIADVAADIEAGESAQAGRGGGSGRALTGISAAPAGAATIRAAIALDASKNFLIISPPVLNGRPKTDIASPRHHARPYMRNLPGLAVAAVQQVRTKANLLHLDHSRAACNDAGESLLLQQMRAKRKAGGRGNTEVTVTRPQVGSLLRNFSRLCCIWVTAFRHEMMYSNDLHGEPTLSPGGARFRGFFLRAPPAIVMTIDPKDLPR